MYMNWSFLLLFAVHLQNRIFDEILQREKKVARIHLHFFWSESKCLNIWCFCENIVRIIENRDQGVCANVFHVYRNIFFHNKSNWIFCVNLYNTRSNWIIQYAIFELIGLQTKTIQLIHPDSLEWPESNRIFRSIFFVCE